MSNNPLIEFLAAYGPTSDGNNMYDEFVAQAAEKAGLEPIKIPEDRSAQIKADVTAAEPFSVLLTGTAGDGKTYTARQVLSELSGGSIAWRNTEAEITFNCKDNGFCIHFIKDLSEVDDATKKTLIPRLLAAFYRDNDVRDVYVVCVNDGHLIKTWREHMGDDPRANSVLNTFKNLLKDDEESADGLAFKLINMSRTSHAKTLDDIIDAICNHTSWSKCPKSCLGMSEETPCPIRENRKIFLTRGPATLRTRLRSLIEIAAADDKHLSIRQLMILIVNALLGDTKNSTHPLLNCNRAQIRAQYGEYETTNPFSNVFGENHLKIRRKQFTAFEALDNFGIGHETNNYFDDELLLDVGNSLPDHPRYGTILFENIRNNYRDNPEYYTNALRKALIAQRRRLFFTTDDIAYTEDREMCPWHLSIHHHGDLYINLLRSKDKSNKDNFKLSQKLIFLGLNRTLTGSLTETYDRLWLTQPTNVYLGLSIPLLVGQPIGWQGDPYYLRIDSPLKPGRAPQLKLVSRKDQSIMSNLVITPTLFEYLIRVAEGALPTSFSNQCFQDIRNFQIKCVGEILEHNKERDVDIQYVAVETNEERLRDSPIGILQEGL